MAHLSAIAIAIAIPSLGSFASRSSGLLALDIAIMIFGDDVDILSIADT